MNRRIIIPIAILLAVTFVIIRAIAIGIEKNEEDETIPPQMRDYQIEVTSDNLYLYDGSRFIGSLPIDSSKLDSLILNDNK